MKFLKKVLMYIGSICTMMFLPKDICPPIFELDENGIPVNSKYNSEEEYFDGHFTLVETLCLECKVLGYCRKGLLTNFPKPN